MVTGLNWPKQMWVIMSTGTHMTHPLQVMWMWQNPEKNNPSNSVTNHDTMIWDRKDHHSRGIFSHTELQLWSVVCWCQTSLAPPQFSTTPQIPKPDKLPNNPTSSTTLMNIQHHPKPSSSIETYPKSSTVKSSKSVQTLSNIYNPTSTYCGLMVPPEVSPVRDITGNWVARMMSHRGRLGNFESRLILHVTLSI